MSRMNAGLILAGQQPDFVNTLARSTQAASLANQNQRQQQMNALYQQHGQGILAGEQGSLNALAQMDPQQALQVQNVHDQRAMQQRQMDMDERAFDLKLGKFVAEASEAEKAKVAENLSNIMIGAIPFYQSGDLEGLNRHLESLGDEPLNSIDEFPAYMARSERAFKALKQVEEFSQDGGPLSAQGKLKADLDAGRITPEQFNAASQKTGIQVTSDGKGGFTFTQGVGVGTDSVTGDSVGDVYNPGEVNQTLGLIKEILDDPSLARVTGPIEGGGGNDVGQLNLGQRTYYGGAGLAVIQKINQLQSRAWLAARDMLKGGGSITDFESRKAEAAVARLERAQGDEEFRAALIDLQDAISSGMAKLEKARGGQEETPGEATFEFQNDEQRQIFEKYQ